MPQSTATLSSTIRKPDDAQSAINSACGAAQLPKDLAHLAGMNWRFERTGDAPGHPDGGNCGGLFPHYPRINVI